MKKFISLIVTSSLVILIMAGCNNSGNKIDEVSFHGSYPTFENLDGLTDKADLVIEGKIINSKFEYIDVLKKPSPSEENNEELNPGGDVTEAKLPYTIFDVEVQKIYKGNISEKSIIQVKQLGGNDGKKIFTLEDAQQLKTNGQYIMFLETYEDSPASLLNPVQGVYAIQNDKIINDEKNPIKFGLKDLEEIENNQMK